MPENDQTRWIGIRPTNPPETIPVSMAAATPCQPVEPCAANNPFNVITKKLTPAISDLSAIEEVYKWEHYDTGYTGDINLDTGAVPAGKLWFMTYAMCLIDNGTLNRMYHIIVDGATEYYVNGLVPVGEGVPLVTTYGIVMEEGEKFRFRFMTVDIVARRLIAAMRAYQVSIYT